MTAVERARADLEAGRLWKARDRLNGVLANDAANQEVLLLLGDLAFQMRDLPAAGCYWFLTDAEGPHVDAAVAAFRERHRGVWAQLTTLPIKAPVNAYPPKVQERIRRLDAETGGRALGLPKFAQPRTPPKEPGFPGKLLVAGVVTVLFGPWLLGVGFAIYVLARLIF